MKAVAHVASDDAAPIRAAAHVRRILRADNMLSTPEPRLPRPRQLSRIEILERRLRAVEQRLGLTGEMA
jgi:hypothetical protein